jgi:hypothetical protein
MKFTVLELVQDILSSMDSDEVNSIGDTIEAQQVAKIVKNVYNDIISTIDLPDEFSLFQLDPSLDPDKPTVMYIPAAYEGTQWIKYNKKGDVTSGSGAPSGTWTTPDGLVIYYGPAEASFGSGTTGATHQQFTDIIYLPREKFLQDIQAFVDTEANIVSYSIDVDGTDIPLLCRNDKQPDYWTIVDNRTILFDSYNAAVDTTLQSSKTMCYGKKTRTFTMSDGWEINLDDRYSSLLFNEAKATCFSELKQIQNTRAEKAARIAKIKTQKNKQAAPYPEPAIDQIPGYGRRYLPLHERKGYYR